MDTAAFVKQLFEETSFWEEPRGLFEPVDYIMHLGGKRLRPQLLITAATLFGGSAEAVAPAAIAIEIFHNFTLVHDDLMDQAPLRRGNPTVHTRWDANTAILSGDTMLVLAYQHLFQLPADNLTDILVTFNDTACGVMRGQQFDMEFERRDDVTIAEYLDMIRLKTAVLLAGALKIGAQCAHAPESDIRHLYQFGIHMGIAFQLQDDLLDAYGDTAILGKQTGQDILDNKKTYLPLRAFELGSVADREELTGLFHSNRNVTAEEKVARVLNIYNRLDIRGRTLEEIDNQFDKAYRSLDQIQLSDDKKDVLRRMAQTLVGRQK